MARRSGDTWVATIVFAVLAIAMIVSVAMIVADGHWPPTPAPSDATSPAAATAPPSDPSDTATARVVRVVDGDTFDAVRADTGEKIRVRVLGIDAPETAHGGAGADCGADAATAALERLVLGREVGLAADPRSDGRDRYGRLLAYVDADGADVGLALVEAGMAEAWHPKSAKKPSRHEMYVEAEKAAVEAGAGLWGQCGTIGR